MDQVANRRLFIAPSEPKEWFYNPQVVRSDSFVAFNTGAALGTKFVPAQIGDFIKWRQSQLLLGISLTAELYSTVTLKGDLGLWLARCDASQIQLAGVSPLIDGGASGLLIGFFLATQEPNGTLINTATKTVGIGYGRIPVLIRGGECLSFYASKGIDGGFNATAIFYTIPAQV